MSRGYPGRRVVDPKPVVRGELGRDLYGSLGLANPGKNFVLHTVVPAI